MQRKDFGPNFKFGVATAAYQIEGAHDVDGKGPSIWDNFSNNSKGIKDNSNGNTACNHYQLFDHDLDTIQLLNLKQYRFSISWSRILPYGFGTINEKGIAFYNELIDGCLKRSIEPWVTLYHWDLPQALQDQGGWTNRKILHWFEEFVTLCLKRFGDRVTKWIVLNEPLAFTGAGYFLGLHAPGKKGMSNFLPAMLHATLCQSLGGKLIRSFQATSCIGTTFSCSAITPATEKDKDLRAANRFDALFNRLYFEPTIGLGYPFHELPILRKVERYMRDGDDESMIFDFDFIGLQNYTREVVKHSWYTPMVWGKTINAVKRNVPITAMNWEIYPEGIHQMLHQFNSYGVIKKIIITENGAAFPDKITDGKIHDHARIDFIKRYLEQILKAKNEGVPVDGYFYWTLLDNFEWAEGYEPRFGLVHVDFNTQKRKIKNSGWWIQEFLGSH